MKLGFRTRSVGSLALAPFPRATLRLCGSPALLVSVLDASSTAFAQVTSAFFPLPGYPNLNYYFF